MNPDNPDAGLEVVLIVAASKNLLQSEMALLLCRPEDVAHQNRELFLTRLRGDALLLNEEQRLAWGCSLNAMGRVYWAVLPEVKAPVRLGKRPNRPGRPRLGNLAEAESEASMNL